MATIDPIALTNRVTKFIAKFIDEQVENFAGIGPEFAVLAEQARVVLSGGKRLRPAFCYAGYACVDAEFDKSLTAVGAAIELLHAAALVHDDVMDGSDERRSHPTAHRAFAARAQAGGAEPSRADSFGQAGAILLGDLLQGWADQAFRTSGFAPAAVAHAGVYFDAMRTEVTAGQFLDVVAQTRGGSDAAAQVELAERVLRYKAASYTVVRPLQIGAALAVGSPDLIDELAQVGVPLGTAFQLRDDMLGVFGDAAVTGKPVGDDLREGKRTLLVAYTEAALTPTQRRTWTRLFGNPGLTSRQITSLQNIIRATGAADQVEAEIARRSEAAATHITALGIPDAARAMLNHLLVLATQRRT